jgi:two-component system phosphate regulon sensor histidine kinase PhoR
VVFNDATQIRRLENMRRDFVANVSHEIKTPLTAIKGFVETLHQGGVDNPEEAERFLGIIMKHVDRLNSIIEDLLSLSRIEQEDQRNEITLKKGPIHKVIQTAIQVCQAKADAKHIAVELNCPPGLTAQFDATLLEQAFVNLLDNAIKFSPENSKIRIEAGSRNSEVFLRFSDQGPGIPQMHLPRLFERFYRVDKARSRKLGGTGLGLAIVKHIVRAHGGQVAVESTVGVGSTFSVHLPGA